MRATNSNSKFHNELNVELLHVTFHDDDSDSDDDDDDDDDGSD